MKKLLEAFDVADRVIDEVASRWITVAKRAHNVVSARRLTSAQTTFGGANSLPNDKNKNAPRKAARRFCF